MATDCGGYLRRSEADNPGNGGRIPEFSALYKVDNAGENRVACAKATSSAGDADPTAARATGPGIVACKDGVGVNADDKERCQRPVEAVRWPVRSVIPLWHTVTVAEVNSTSQPASQSWLIESSEEEVSSGTMWTWRAAGGRAGRSSSASCVEYMSDPFGVEIQMGVVVTRRLITCASMVQK